MTLIFNCIDWDINRFIVSLYDVIKLTLVFYPIEKLFLILIHLLKVLKLKSQSETLQVIFRVNIFFLSVQINCLDIYIHNGKSFALPIQLFKKMPCNLEDIFVLYNPRKLFWPTEWIKLLYIDARMLQSYLFNNYYEFLTFLYKSMLIRKKKLEIMKWSHNKSLQLPYTEL